MKPHRTVIWLSAVAVCFTVSSYLRFPILRALSSIEVGSEYVETLPRFDSQYLEPIGFHHFPATHDQRVAVKLSFLAESTTNTPNIIQTADGNNGVRLELDGSKLSLVYPGKYGITGAVLSERIQQGRWYDVDIAYQSGDSISAFCSGGKPFNDTRIGRTSTAGVVVGRGFNEERRFEGLIRDFSIQSEPRLGMASAEVIYLAIDFLLIAIGGIAVWRMAKCTGDFAAPNGALIKIPATGPIDPLLTLRGLALVQVLVGHLFMCVFVSYRLPSRLEEEPWLCLLTPAPWAGVWMFFTLSGYLMGKGFYSGRYSLSPQRVYRYLSNRFVRIVPVYISAVLVVSVAFYPHIFHREHLAVLGSILLFDYQGLERVNPIGALWSVSTEAQFYVLVPILFFGLTWLLGERQQRVVKVAVAVLVGGVLARVLIKEVVHREGVSPYIYRPLLSNLDLFVLGMLANPLLAQIRVMPWVNRFATVRNGLLLIAGAYLASSWIGGGVVSGKVDLNRVMIYGPTLVAAVTMLIIGCCELGAASQRSAGFVRRALLVGNGIGLLAYPIYVWHEPILLELRKLAPTPLSMGDAVKFSLIATFITWTVAECIYRYIELPTERMKKKKQATGLAASDESPATIPLRAAAPASEGVKAA